MAGDELKKKLGESKKIGDSAELLKECEEVEEELAGLRAQYEQYFIGIERKPPDVRHRAVKSRINKLRAAFVKSTAVKFRIQSLWTKYSSFDRLWTRTLQEMEAGTYRRDLMRLRMRQKAKEAEANTAKAPAARAEPAEPSDSIAAALAAAQAKGGKPAPPTAAKPGGPPRPAAAGGDGSLSDDKVRAIFDAYVAAKKRNNEDVSRVSFDAVAQNLRKQVPELLKKHNAQSVEFKVVVKDGKTQLRAVPKGGSS